MTNLANKVPLNLPPKYSDIIPGLTEWARVLFEKIENEALQALGLADAAQGDATAALTQVAELSTAATDALKEINFLGGAR